MTIECYLLLQHLTLESHLTYGQHDVYSLPMLQALIL